jgi:4-carboxymuconolactone decarboxylase
MRKPVANRILSRMLQRLRVGGLVLLTTGLLGSTLSAAAEETGAFSTRLGTPRVAPLIKDKDPLTQAQRDMLGSRADINIYKTLAHDVQLYNRWTPLGRYLLNGSGLPPRERELIILRMGWLCQAEYEWAQHARIAITDAGLTAQEVQRIAIGPIASEWSQFERVLLSMVDELRYDTKISDSTWAALRAHYSLEQTLDALFTAAQYQLVSMALNSLGVQLDPGLAERLPAQPPKPALAGSPGTPRLRKPRVAPLPEAQWSADQRALITDDFGNGKVQNLYTTLLQHQALYGPRRTFGRYLQRESRLAAQPRELLILRTAWLIGCEYEWAHHVEFAKQAGFTDADIKRIAAGPTAKDWSMHYAAVLQAADELRREAFISDATWRELARHYDTPQLIEIIFTVGGYSMTGLAINSLGIEVERGYPRMPKRG